MAVLVMVYGHSGSGKSAITNDYGKIDAAIRRTKRKSIVIDDATYLATTIANNTRIGSKITEASKFKSNYDRILKDDIWRLLTS